MLLDVERAISGRCLHFKMLFFWLTKLLSLFKELFPHHAPLLADTKRPGSRESLPGLLLVYIQKLVKLGASLFYALITKDPGVTWLIDIVPRAKFRLSHHGVRVLHKLHVLR